MTSHRDVVARKAAELAERYPGCGVLLGGSVQRGQERADSDIDLFVVYPGEGEVRLEHERSAEGIKIDLALFPEAALHKELRAAWYRFWMFSRAEIVHDPTGIARRSQDAALSCFREHPEIDRAWEHQVAEVRRHKADRSYQLTFWTWDDFATHIERMVKGDC